MWLPILLVAAGVGGVIVFFTTAGDDGPVPKHEPDLPPTPGSTRYRKIDAILPQLKAAAAQSGVPLGFLIGWIAKESGGRLEEAPKPLKGERASERGYFQLTPSESDKLGLDHARLSTDSDYSIAAGIKLIGMYIQFVDGLGVTAARKGTPYYWDLVKLGHTMGKGAVEKIIAAAKAAGDTGSWDDLEQYALANDSALLSSTHHSPKKWFPFVDDVRAVGQPFGWGSLTVAGADLPFPDIIDPLDCLT